MNPRIRLLSCKNNTLFVACALLLACTRGGDKTNKKAAIKENVQQVAVEYADGFKLSYYDGYKIAEVSRPWKNAEKSFQYILVQDRSQLQDVNLQDALVIDLPVKSAVCITSVSVSALQALNETERIAGVSEREYTSDDDVVKLIDDGQIFEVGNSIENIVELDPDVVFTNSIGNPEVDLHERLFKMGIPVVVLGEYMEATPLGRAEWLKFISAFFNKEALAESIFDSVKQEYLQNRKLTHNIDERPAVFIGNSIGDSWWVAGGQSYMAHFFKDAGASYIWKDDTTRGGLNISFEVVYEKAVNANFWLLHQSGWQKSGDILKADTRYGDFKAVKNSNVYRIDNKLSKSGANDYWGSAQIYPHTVLKDLIHVFHPDVLPDHQLIYLKRISNLKVE